jgi:hypothetical protein
MHQAPCWPVFTRPRPQADIAELKSRSAAVSTEVKARHLSFASSPRARGECPSGPVPASRTRSRRATSSQPVAFILGSCLSRLCTRGGPVFNLTTGAPIALRIPARDSRPGQLHPRRRSVRIAILVMLVSRIHFVKRSHRVIQADRPINSGTLPAF